MKWMNETKMQIIYYQLMKNFIVHDELMNR